MRELTRKAGRKALFSKGKMTTSEKEEKEEIEEKYDNGIEHRLKEFLEALEAVRRGDLTKKLEKEGEGIFDELADSYNGMIDLLNFSVRK